MCARAEVLGRCVLCTWLPGSVSTSPAHTDPHRTTPLLHGRVVLRMLCVQKRVRPKNWVTGFNLCVFACFSVCWCIHHEVLYEPKLLMDVVVVTLCKVIKDVSVECLTFAKI